MFTDLPFTVQDRPLNQYLELSDINVGCPVEFEFQKNNKKYYKLTYTNNYLASN